MVIPLKTLIESLDDAALGDLLNTFSCALDEDIEFFLQHRAVEFEKLSKARTYLIFDVEELKEGKEHPIIYGYLSLALKILTVPSSVSNKMRRELDGFNAKIHGHQISDFPCYLIGQLSKNSSVSDNPLSGRDLLNISFDIIAAASEAVGGRYMMIESRNEEKLLKFYTDNSFNVIDHIPDEDVPMVQMIRRI